MSAGKPTKQLDAAAITTVTRRLRDLAGRLRGVDDGIRALIRELHSYAGIPLPQHEDQDSDVGPTLEEVVEVMDAVKGHSARHTLQRALRVLDVMTAQRKAKRNRRV